MLYLAVRGQAMPQRNRTIMKISRLIFISIAFILVLFSITTLINFNQSRKVRENANFFSISSGFIRQTNQLQRNILDMERSLRGFLITGEKYLLQTYDSGKVENNRIFLELSSFSPDNTSQQLLLNQISNSYEAWKQQIAEPLKAAKLSARGPAANVQTFEKIYLTEQLSRREDSLNTMMQQYFSKLRNAEYANREVNRDVLETSESQTKFISFALTALSIITGCVIAWLLARHISRRIATMVHLADGIAGGDYHLKLLDKSDDELSKLSQSLNDMAQTLLENILLLQRKNAELDQFAHIVSHDIKAPLRGIDNVVGWIEEDYGDDVPVKVKEYLGLIKGRIIRLENMIRGILSYARIGKEQNEKEQVNVLALVQDIRESLPAHEGVEVSIAPDLPQLFTDKIPLTQVFTNLLSNALKYHDKSPGWVRVYCVDFKDHVTFFVEDNGPGIAASHQEKIFIIFQTLLERDSFESTGVGLAIVKKIMMDRKEKIILQSEPGKGATFSFTWRK
ncbi:MAG: hypothetical protein JWQ27_2148 [Ferruginibacter sp.]|nr:hypothetical protein [Ferruginibacter sp.]